MLNKENKKDDNKSKGRSSTHNEYDISLHEGNNHFFINKK